MLSWFLNNWEWVVGSIAYVVITPVIYFNRKPRALMSMIRSVEHSHNLFDNKQEEHNIFLAELDKMPIGKIIFNPPSLMTVGKEERVEVRISKDINTNLSIAMKGRGIAQTELIKVSSFMKVRLSGNDFTITSLNEPEQVIEAKKYTEWAWDIFPNKSGDKILHLHVTLRIKLPDGEEKKDHPVLDKEVLVKIDPVYSVKLFCLTHWKLILTTITVPLVVFLFKDIVKKWIL